MSQVKVKGEKKQIASEIIKELAGPSMDFESVTFSQVNMTCKKKYNCTLSDKTFYKERLRLVRERNASKPPENKPTIASLVLDRIERAGIPVPKEEVKQETGVAAMVRQLKQVVSKFGKDETKELIDAL